MQNRRHNARKRIFRRIQKKVIKSCDEAKENGGKVGDVLGYYGVSSGSVSMWRKKFREQPECPEEVMKEFGVDPCGNEIEPQGSEEAETSVIKINDEYRREAVIVALVTSGYVVWETQYSGDYFINYQ